MTQAPLTTPFTIGAIEIPNRVLLAPLAGIGNWFVRLQASRHGAGMAFSEMVSSFALHYGSEKTREMYGGTYFGYAFGELTDRCFAIRAA